MNRNESFQGREIFLIHLDSIGAIAGAGLASSSVVFAGRALEGGDINKAAIGIGVSLVAGVAAKVSFDNYSNYHDLLVDTLDRSAIAEPVDREQDPARVVEALDAMGSRLEQKKVALFEESVKIKKIEDGNVWQHAWHITTELERPETTRSHIDKKLNYINCVLRELRAGIPDEAIRYFRSSIQEQIRATQRLRGEAVNNWSDMLGDAERDVRILEEIDYEAAVGLRAEISKIRESYLSR